MNARRLWIILFILRRSRTGFILFPSRVNQYLIWTRSACNGLRMRGAAFFFGVLISATECDDCCLSGNNVIKATITDNYCSSSISFFLFSQRSENPWSRIFLNPTGALRPNNTRCSGSFSCYCYQMLCYDPSLWPDAQGQKWPLCLFPHRGTLPESRE